MASRRLRVRRRPRVAAPALGDGWRGGDVHLAGARAPHAARALAIRWLAMARAEHASIAAFAQLSLQLAALGAPARLLAATHRAALDEIDHAERCFAIARALDAAPHDAGPIVALAAGPSPAVDLAGLAVESLVDGCVGEGVAAELAARGAATAADPCIRATLTVIAADERRQAELAWDLLAWCLAAGDARVARAVAVRLDRLPALASAIPASDLDDDLLAAHGLVPAAVARAIAATTISTVARRTPALLAMPTLAAA